MVENILLLFTASSVSKTLILHSSRSWITQGFIPIAGYNYGAELMRVKESIQISIKYAAISNICFVIILYYASYHCHFTSNEKIIAEAPSALRWVFAASPVIAVQLIELLIFKLRVRLKANASKQGFS
jgi:hypothetical protein